MARLRHLLFEVLASLLLLALAATAFGAWRLSRGPLSIGWLTPYLEAAASRDGGINLTIGDTRLAWVQEPVMPGIDGPLDGGRGGGVAPRHHGSLEVVGEDVSLRAPDGTLVASLPEIRTAFSVPALLEGHLAPSRVSLVRPRLNGVRDGDGGFHLALALDDDDTGGGGFFAQLLEALRRPPHPSRPLGALSRVAVRDALLVVDDRKAGRRWTAQHVDIFLAHDAQGIRGYATLGVDLGGGRQAQLASTLRYTVADGGLVVETRFHDLDPRDVLRLWTPPATTSVPSSTPATPAPAPAPAPAMRGAAPGASASGSTGPDGPSPAATDWFSGLTLPLDGAFSVSLDRAFKPVSADVRLSAVNGVLALPGRLAAPLTVRSLALQAHLEPNRVDVRTLSLDLGGPTVSLKGGLTRQGPAAAYDLAVEGEVRGLPLAGLDRYWPRGMLPNPRAWILKNLADGTFDRTSFQVAGALAPDFSSLALRRAHADMAFSGATVTYMDGLPPARGVGGSAVYEAGRLTMTLNQGQVPNAKLGPLKLGAGRLVFAGLDAPDQTLDIDLPVSGSTAAALALIDRPPLGYASKVGIRPDTVGGYADIDLRFTFPLVAALRMDQVKLGVKAALSGVAIPHVVGSIDASEGHLALVLDNQGMDVTGTARLNGMAAKLAWRENFSDVAPLSTRLNIQALAGDGDRQRLHLDFPDWVRGAVGVNLVYTKDARHQERMDATLDLTDAGLALPLLDWRKVPGTPASGSFSAVFERGQPLHFTHFQIESRGTGGVIDMTAQGSADLWPDSYALRHLVVDHYHQGGTDAQLTLDVDSAGAMRVDAHGATLDARGIRRQAAVDRPRTPAALKARQAAAALRPPLDVRFDFKRVIADDDGHEVADAHGLLARRGRRWTRVEVNALVGEAPVATPATPATSRAREPGGRHPAPSSPATAITPTVRPARLVVRYEPDGAAMALSVDAEDAGAALRVAGILEHVRGGSLAVRGRTTPGDPDEVVHGSVTMNDFQVVDAPVLARLLSAASFQGLSDFVSGAPISFTMLKGNFRWTDTGIDLRDIHTSGAAIGITLEGQINLNAATADLQGTIVPFSTLNKVLDSIPLIGSLLSGGEGQGLLSATYHIKGPLDDLDVSVNPLAVLAPGFLRNLFFLSPTPEDKAGDGKGGADGKTPPPAGGP